MSQRAEVRQRLSSAATQKDAEQAGGDRPDDDEPAHPLVGTFTYLVIFDTHHQGTPDLKPISPEIDQERDACTEVERCDKWQEAALSSTASTGLQIAPTQQPW